MKFIAASFFPLLICFFVIGCSSTPTETVPSWVRQPVRTVDNGYIVYVESEDDVTRDQARLKAEGLALQDLANECTFIPKGTRIEDRWDTKTGHLIQSYAKIAVEFQICEDAKKSTDPERIRKLADVPLMEEIKKFKSQYGEPSLEVADNSVASGTNPDGSANVNFNPGQGTPVASNTAINENQGYFVARQQIVFIKEQVVFAPATAYPPASPAATQVSQTLTEKQMATTNYAAAHPQVAQAPQNWSYYRHNMMRAQNMAPANKAPAAKPAAAAPPARFQRRRRRQFR